MDGSREAREIESDGWIEFCKVQESHILKKNKSELVRSACQRADGESRGWIGDSREL